MRNKFLNFTYSLLFLLLSILEGAEAQSNQSKSDTIGAEWIEKYEMLREGSYHTKNGTYLLINPAGKTIISGNYLLGKKTGKWEYYDPENTFLVAEGSFDLDKPTGFWEYYNKEGETWLIYSFDKEQVDIINENGFKNNHLIQITYYCDKKGEVACQPDQKPRWLSPYDPFTYLKLQSLSWNRKPENELWRQLILDISIDAYGSIEKISIDGVSKDWEIIILESMKKYLPNFIPSEIEGALTEIMIRLQIKQE
jgi:hypothetical protein